MKETPITRFVGALMVAGGCTSDEAFCVELCAGVARVLARRHIGLWFAAIVGAGCNSIPGQRVQRSPPERSSEQRVERPAPETSPKQRSEFGNVGLPRAYSSKAPPPELTAPTRTSAQPVESAQVGPERDRWGSLMRPAKPAVPVRLGRADLQKAAALRGVCAIGTSEWHYEDPSTVTVGCTCCFYEDSCPPDAPPKLHPWTRYRLKSMYDGSFTAPGRGESILVMTGCESSADNSGSSYLVERGPERSEPKRFRGLNPDACVVLPTAAGRDRLACWNSGPRGTQAELDLHDFNSVPEVSRRIGTFAASYSICINGIDDPPSRYRHTRLESIRRRLAPGKAPQVVVEVTFVDTLITREIAASCKGGDYRNHEAPPPLVPTSRYWLVYSGENMTPTPRTEKLERLMYADPDNL